jgi:hypothetical protein
MLRLRLRRLLSIASTTLLFGVTVFAATKDEDTKGMGMATRGMKSKSSNVFEDIDEPPSSPSLQDEPKRDEDPTARGDHQDKVRTQMGMKKGMMTSNNDRLNLRIMSYNIWGGGSNEDKPVDETVAVIRAAQADIVGLQETRLESDPCTAQSCPPAGESVARSIVTALGYYYYDQTAVNAAVWANAVVSRYPILSATKNDLGVAIDVAGETVFAYNLHLTDYPYQPCTCDRAREHVPCRLASMLTWLEFFTRCFRSISQHYVR